MKCVLIHGMGQGATSWNGVISSMGEATSVAAPDLWYLLNGKDATYKNLYTAFAVYLDSLSSEGVPLSLCGLSLGGRLALNYALDYPEKVGSLMLVGVQYKTPKGQTRMQKLIFKLMPSSVFKNMGLTKKEMISLSASLTELDFSPRLKDVSCPTSVLYGEKDSPAIKQAAEHLAKTIPRAQLAYIQNAGHQVNEHNPKDLALKITEFFNCRK